MKGKIIRLVMCSSIFAMVGGFMISLYGVSKGMDAVTYVGLGMMIMTCIFWWFWVMNIIGNMMNNIENSGKNIHSVKEEIRELKNLFKQLLRPGDK